MKRFLTIALVVAIADISMSANAEDRPWRLGGSLGIGAPSGANVSIVMEPWTHWTRIEAGLSYNVLSFGGIASATFTPIKFPIMPVAFVEGGFFPNGSVPSFMLSGKTLPSAGYDWVSFGPGLEFGNRDSVVFFIHPAITYIHATAGNFQSVVNANGGGPNGMTFGDPTVSGFIAPTLRLGLSVLF
jgi:hypothetical protein